MLDEIGKIWANIHENPGPDFRGFGLRLWGLTAQHETSCLIRSSYQFPAIWNAKKSDVEQLGPAEIRSGLALRVRGHEAAEKRNCLNFSSVSTSMLNWPEGGAIQVTLPGRLAVPT